MNLYTVDKYMNLYTVDKYMNLYTVDKYMQCVALHTLQFQKNLHRTLSI